MEKLVMVVLVCFIIVLTLIDITAVATAKIQLNNARNLTSQIQQQQNAINTFVAQLQRCQTLEDVDKVLGANGVERVK